MATKAEIASAITQGVLLSRLGYDPDTGELWWKAPVANRIKTGDTAGSVSVHGYIVVCINNRSFKAHRIIWMMMTGKWPEEIVDHVNGDKADNRWQNLRPATKRQNAQNMGAKRNGLKGAFKNSTSNRWMSSIMLDGKNKYLGNFATEEDAHSAYVEASRRYFGEFARAS